MQPGLATKHAPSFSLIRTHFVLGIGGMCAFGAALLVASPALGGHHFQPLLLGLVHLCVLGWLLPVALGALHQLVPVLFEVPIASERVAWVALGGYAVGASGLVLLFFGMWVGGGFFAAAALLTLALVGYTANLLLTVWRSRARSLTNTFVICALLWLLIGVGLGFVLSWNLWRPFLPLNHLMVLRAHAHAAGLGFFGLLIAGVALRLLEMFLISHGAPQRAGRLSLWLLNAGVASLVVGFSFPRGATVAAIGAVLVGVGVIAFTVQVRAVLARRVKRKLDAAWRLSVSAFVYLGIAAALGIGLVLLPLGPEVRERAVLGYGLLAIPGFIGSIVVGQLYKIVPFLIWLHRFSPYVGLKKLPPASELLPEPPRRLHEALLHAGLWTLVAGVAMDVSTLRVIGALVFFAAAIVGARNLWILFRSQP
jgi:hypothetical protein